MCIAACVISCILFLCKYMYVGLCAISLLRKLHMRLYAHLFMHMYYVGLRLHVSIVLYCIVLYFYSFSQPEPFNPTIAIDTVSEFTHGRALQATVSEGLAQDPYVAAIAGFEPTTLRLKDIDSANAPTRPTIIMYASTCIYVHVLA